MNGIVWRQSLRGSYTQLYLHCVWATWDRLPLITPEVEGQIHASIVAKCIELKCNILAVNGIEDHVHLLLRFPSTLSVATLVGEAKGASSHMMTHSLRPGTFFKWQGAYGAFTLQKGGIDKVAAYIKNQKAHHASNNIIADWERCEDEEA